MPRYEVTPASPVRQSGEDNPNWRGGRSVTSVGYALIRVGVGHHLADARGYAYEHRVVAEEKIGRRLESGEQVHHINGDKSDNRPENLEVYASLAEHFVCHRSSGSRLRMPGEPNPDVMCACGCGEVFPRFDGEGRSRDYALNHYSRLAPAHDAILSALDEAGPMTKLQLAQVTGLSRESLRNALSRMKRRGTITNVTYGVWARKEG
jgi:hypothetical protein